MFEPQSNNYKLSDVMTSIAKSVTDVFPFPIWVEAEIMAISKGPTGHYYLELIESDEKGAEVCKNKASIWSSKANLILEKFKKNTGSDLKSGIKVLVKCKISFHAKYQLSISIEDINPEFTLGGMELKVKEILKKLDNEGLTNKNKVLKQPFDFSRLAVVAPSGAAGLGDFKKDADILEKYNICKFDYFEATFQGNDTNKSVTTAINKALINATDYDALIIIRGGGAKTDLHFLNEFDIAASICLAPIPVFVGVGHERDKGVLDHVAHTSFDTPSKVIGHIFAIVVNNATIIKNAIKTIETTSRNLVSKNTMETEQYFELIALHAKKNVQLFKTRIETLSDNIKTDSKNNILKFKTNINTIFDTSVMMARNNIRNLELLVNQKYDYVLHQGKHMVTMTIRDIENLDKIISGYNPEYILKMGFIVAKKEGKVISEIAGLNVDDELDLTFRDGTITVKIIGEK